MHRGRTGKNDIKDTKMEEKDKIKIQSIMELLGTERLKVPSYQRPYKWSEKNIDDLLSDIENALDRQKELGSLGNSEFKYRVGTVLLHKNTEKDSMALGLIRKSTLGKNSPTNSTNMVDKSVCTNSIRKSFGILMLPPMIADMLMP